jgi:hypothetical protein
VDQFTPYQAIPTIPTAISRLAIRRLQIIRYFQAAKVPLRWSAVLNPAMLLSILASSVSLTLNHCHSANPKNRNSKLHRFALQRKWRSDRIAALLNKVFLKILSLLPFGLIVERRRGTQAVVGDRRRRAVKLVVVARRLAEIGLRVVDARHAEAGVVDRRRLTRQRLCVDCRIGRRRLRHAALHVAKACVCFACV